jgi:1-pyrroline-5-carboxylate dehydrogenase
MQGKKALNAELDRLSSEVQDIPLIIGGKEVRTGKTGKVVMPHDHQHVLANYHLAGEKEVRMAIDAALKAHKEWESFPWVDRVSITLKAAELISKKYRFLDQCRYHAWVRVKAPTRPRSMLPVKPSIS